MSYDELRIWDVGQGLFTMALDKERNRWSIFDCGTIAQNLTHPTIKILSKVETLLSQSKGIDSIVLSHQDSDHWNMLKDILSMHFGTKKKGRFYKKERFLCWISLNKVICIQKLSDVDFSINYHLFGEFVFFSIYYEICQNNDIYELKRFFTHYSAGKYELDQYLRYDYCTGPDFKTRTYLECCYSSKKKYEMFVSFEEEHDITDPDIVVDALRNKDYQEEWEKSCKDSSIYLKSYISALCRYAAEQLHKYKEYINALKSDEPEINNMPPIERVVWGRRYAEPDCQAMQKIVEHLRDVGLIEIYDPEGYGALFRIEDYWGELIHKMFLYKYNLSMKDVNKNVIDKEEIKKNATSVITYLLLKNKQRCLLPGDLTVHAFQRLKYVLYKYYNEESDMSTLLVAPHHGSGDTNFCILEGDMKTQPLEDLLDELF